MECSKSSPKREVLAINTYLKKKKVSNKQSNFTPQGTRKRRTNKTQSQQKEGNKKIRAEVSETEIKKTIKKDQ